MYSLFWQIRWDELQHQKISYFAFTRVSCESFLGFILIFFNKNETTYFLIPIFKFFREIWDSGKFHLANDYGFDVLLTWWAFLYCLRL